MAGEGPSKEAREKGDPAAFGRYPVFLVVLSLRTGESCVVYEVTGIKSGLESCSASEIIESKVEG